MEFVVEVTDRALNDAEEYYRFLQQDRQELQYADCWWNGLMDALLSLESMPRRCPVIRKGEHPFEELRHLIYQSHLIVFYVTGETVRVLRIYHGARRPLAEMS